jgi:hypothetical protein
LAFDTRKRNDTLHIRIWDVTALVDVDWRQRSIVYGGETYSLCNGNIFIGALEGERFVIKQHRGNCPVSGDDSLVLRYFKTMLPEDRDVQNCRLQDDDES